MRFADAEAPKFADDDRPTLADFDKGTYAWLIQRVIDDVEANPTMKQFNDRFMYHYRFLQGAPFCTKKQFASLKKQDYIEYGKKRKRAGAGVGASTVKHDFVKLRGVLKYAMVNWSDCEDITTAELDAAVLFLQKHEIVGKAPARVRTATDEEKAQLIAHFRAENGRGRNEITGMPDLLEFAWMSARRRGEICRITWGDIDFEQQIYWVRDMKHPTKKKGNDKQFTLWPELAVILKRLPRLRPNDPTERIFPYNGNVIGQKFVVACHALGIKGLRFHDLRATAISMWILRGMPIEDVRLCVSGHDNTAILEKVYDRRTSEDVATEKYAHWLKQEPPQALPSPAPVPAGVVVPEMAAA